MTKPALAAFSEEEHRERLTRAREALAAAGYDGCIVVAPENLFYLAGYDSIASFISPQALIFSVKNERDPTLVVRNLDLPLARETSWVGDVRVYQLNRDDVGELIARIAREHGLGDGRLGLEMQSYAVTAAYARQIAKAMPSSELEDAGSVLNRIQYVKSPAEMKYIREAASYANRGVAAARENLRAGMSEIELCAAVEFAMRRAGSDYPAIPTECASGWRSIGGHAAAMPKIIEAGDIVHLEFAGAARRYHSVSMITMAAGEPGPRARELYNIGRESLQAGLAKCRPDAAVAEIDTASLEPLKHHGLREAAQMRFGVGIGIGYPPVWVGTFQIDRFSEGSLVPGMVFYVHSWMSLADEGIGVMLGGTFYVSETGTEQLSGAGAVDLFVSA
jgi:Xaa-Pro aminopeptidase